MSAKLPTSGLALAVLASVVGHVGMVVVVWWAQSIEAAPKQFKRSIPVQLVRRGKKRDPELLPRLTSPPPPPAPKPEGVSLKKPDEKKKPDKRDQQQKDELSNRAQELLNRDPDLDRALEKMVDGDPDGDELGTVADAAVAAAGYQRKLLAALQAAYKLPEAIPTTQRAFLNAKVALYIEPGGQVRDFEILERHPNRLFMTALEGMLKNLELPPPPRELAEALRRDGVVVTFRP